MNTTLIVGIAIIDVIIAYLLADKFKRQGYNFWKILFLGSLALFGISMMIYAAATGAKWQK